MTSQASESRWKARWFPIFLRGGYVVQPGDALVKVEVGPTQAGDLLLSTGGQQGETDDVGHMGTVSEARAERGTWRSQIRSVLAVAGPAPSHRRAAAWPMQSAVVRRRTFFLAMS